MSDFLDKAKDLAADHSDKIADGVDKATDLAADKLPDHAEKIQSVDGLAQKALDSLDGDPSA